jgi:AGZA family xanthine/uracil permease-like MFS transporter
MPVVAEWAQNTIVTGITAGYSNFTVPNVQFTSNVTSAISAFSYRGLVNFAGGSLLQCIFITAILMYTIDRKFVRAAIWSVLAGLLALFGIIHAKSVGVLIKHSDDGWRFTVAYTMIAVIFGILHLAQRKNWIKAAATEPDELPNSE